MAKTNILKIEEVEEIALQIVKDLKNAGFMQSYFVGGYVRDKLLGIALNELIDIDIATEARPEKIKKIFNKEKFIEVGEAFNIIIIIIKGYKFEIATFREDLFGKDKTKWDGRYPLDVSFATAEDDAKRRDFTINAIFYDPVEKKHLDFVNGIEDIDKKIIRTIGEPKERFREDYLRMLRAIRFAVQKNFKIDPKVMEAIKLNAEKIRIISNERIQIELNKILSSNNPSYGLKLLRDCNLLRWIYLIEQKPIEFRNEDFLFTQNCLKKTSGNLLINQVIFFQILHVYILDISNLRDVLVENKFDKKTIGNIIWILNGKKSISNWGKLSEYEKMELSIHNQFENLLLFFKIEEETKNEIDVGTTECKSITNFKVASGDTYSANAKNIKNIEEFYENFKNNKIKWEQMKKFTIINGNDLLEIGIKGKKIGDTLSDVKRKYILGELNSREEILKYIMKIKTT